MTGYSDFIHRKPDKRAGHEIQAPAYNRPQPGGWPDFENLSTIYRKEGWYFQTNHSRQEGVDVNR